MERTMSQFDAAQLITLTAIHDELVTKGMSPEEKKAYHVKQGWIAVIGVLSFIGISVLSGYAFISYFNL
jgi:hypothetical protein